MIQTVQDSIGNERERATGKQYHASSPETLQQKVSPFIFYIITVTFDLSHIVFNSSGDS